MIALSVIEFAAIVFLIWGYAHEEQFIRWETKMKNKICIKLMSNKRFMAWLNKPPKSLCETAQDDFMGEV